MRARAGGLPLRDPGTLTRWLSGWVRILEVSGPNLLKRGGHGRGHGSFFDQVVDPVDEILKLYPPARVREPLNKVPVLDTVKHPPQRVAHVLEHPYRVRGARPVHPHWQGSLGRGHSVVHGGQDHASPRRRYRRPAASRISGRARRCPQR